MYWVVRYVPNLVREEFVNIGIVCGREDGDWAVQFDDHQGGRSATSSLADLRPWQASFEQELRSRQVALIPAETSAMAWIEQLRAEGRSAIRLSAPRPVMADSARAAVDLLFPLMVARKKPQQRMAVRSRVAMRKGIEQAFQADFELVPGRTMFSRPKVRIGCATDRFDVARDAEGDVVLTNAWSFRVRDVLSLQRDIRAANWGIDQIREGHVDAVLSVAGEDRGLDASVRIEAVYDPPVPGRGDREHMREFEQAREIWRASDVVARPYDEVTASPTLALAD